MTCRRCGEHAQHGYADLGATGGATLTAVCLGYATGGTQDISVMSSSNDGQSWKEMCDNGIFQAPPATEGACPMAGYPTSLSATADGTLLMGLTRAGVATSSDGGKSWHTDGFAGGGYPVVVASVGKHAWAVSPSVDLVLSTSNGGRSWTEWPFIVT